MSSNNQNEKHHISSIIANIFVIFLVVIAMIIIMSIPILGLYGGIHILTIFHLAKVESFDSTFYKLVYFGALMLVLLITSIILELLINLFERTLSFSYVIQLAASVILYKFVIENIFNRIHISWVGSILLFSLIYALYFFISDDYKMIKRRKAH